MTHTLPESSRGGHTAVATQALNPETAGAVMAALAGCAAAGGGLVHSAVDTAGATLASHAAQDQLLTMIASGQGGIATRRIAEALLDTPSGAMLEALIELACNTQGAVRESLVLALRSHFAVVSCRLAEWLGSRDRATRLDAVRLVEALGGPQAATLLAGLIETENDVEVCLAAAVALGEHGDYRVVPALQRASERFAGNNAVSFTISVALGQIE